MKPRTENKFAAILQARHDSTDTEPAPVVATPTRPAIAPVVVATAAVEKTRRLGRPPEQGKRSDPTFRQVTAYIPQELHSNATIALRLANQVRIDADKEDFSELLTRLLANWYEKQTFYRPSK